MPLTLKVPRVIARHLWQHDGGCARRRAAATHGGREIEPVAHVSRLTQLDMGEGWRTCSNLVPRLEQLVENRRINVEWNLP